MFSLRPRIKLPMDSSGKMRVQTSKKSPPKSSTKPKPKPQKKEVLPFANLNSQSGIRRQAWRIALVVILGTSTTPLVGIVDTALLGHLAHPHYIGSVAIGSFVLSLVLALFSFLRMATTGVIAQAAGADDKAALTAHFYRAGLCGLALGIVVLLCGGLIIRLADISLTMSDAVASGMASYLKIVFLAAPAITINMVILGVLFGLQKISLTLIKLLVVNLTNIVASAILVLGFGWRVDGVALGTVIAHYTGLVVMLPVLLSALGRLRISITLPAISVLLNLSALAGYLRLGFDLTIRTLMIILGELVVLNSASAIDDVSLAATQIGFVLFAAIAYPLDGFAHAAEALVGAFIGRKSPKLLDYTLRETTRLAIIASGLMSLVLLLGGSVFVHVLTSIPEVVARAHEILFILIVMPMISVFAFQMDGVFIGATMGRVMRNAMLVSFAVFIVVLLLIGDRFGLIGIWLAFLLFVAMRGVSLAWQLPKVRELAHG